MNLKQLQAFREVMLTGSASEAARNLNCTQPAISSLIAGLESNLGRKLFLRQNSRLSPVPEAHYLFQEASDILQRLANTRQNMSSLLNLESGSLKIAAMPGPSVFLLPKLINEFVENRDGVKVTLTTRSSPHVLQLLSTQQYDVGLADSARSDDKEFSLVDHRRIDCNCLCAIRRGDPLAAKDKITPADLDAKPMAALFAEHATHRQTKAAFDAAGAQFDVRFETQYFIPLFTFVEAGNAYAIVDPLSAKSYQIYSHDHEKIVFRRFEPAVPFVLSVLTPSQRPLSSLAEAFAEFVSSEIEQIKTASLSNMSYQ